MRNYDDKGNLLEAYCNCCGKRLRTENGFLREGCFHGDFTWGYFSQKDGTTQKFDLCEACFDRITDEFQIPVNEEDTVELL